MLFSSCRITSSKRNKKLVRIVKTLQKRINLVKNRRSTIVRYAREDLAQLIKSGHREIAIKRAEQLFKDEQLVAVYELLQQFCKFLVRKLPYICSDGNCVDSLVEEAVSSLIFASERCRDVPELVKLQDLLRKRYGDIFTVSVLEGNLVNSQIREKLLIKSVTLDAREKLVAQIIEYTSVIIDNKEQAIYDDPVTIDSNKETAPFKEDSCCAFTTCPENTNEMPRNSTDQYDESTAVYENLDDNVEEIEFKSVDGPDIRLFEFELEFDLILTVLERETNRVSLEKSRQNTQLRYPKHVHPKLPDYDEMKATFSLFKKAWEKSSQKIDYLGGKEESNFLEGPLYLERDSLEIKASENKQFQYPKYVHPKLLDYER